MLTGMGMPGGWVGCYTSQSGGDPGGGIGRLAWDGDRPSVRLAAPAPDPSYLALSPDRRTLYAVHELDQGTVGAYAVRGDALDHLGDQPTGGAHPCHVLVHPTGRFVLSANYGTGSVAVHPVRADGSLGPATDVVQHRGSGPDSHRQAGPHAHMVTVDPAGEHLFVADLGTDAVVTYRLDPGAGTLTETSRLDLPPGSGPRHLAFHPSGSAAYVLGELDSSLTSCRHEEGVLTAVSTVATRPAGAGGANLPAAVLMSPDGKRVHVTNRGDDTVATFQLAGGGLLARLVSTSPTGGARPRDLAQSPDGATLFAANELSGTVTVLRAGSDGRFGPVASAHHPAPTCVVLAD